MLPNLGEFGLRTGDWSAAEEELRAALTEDWEPVDRNWLVIALLPITAARGETIDEPMAEAHSLMTQSGDVQQPSSLLMTEGLVGLALGDLADAREAFHRATSLYSPLLPTSAPRAARCALWMGDGAAAAADLGILEASGFHGPAIDADRRTIKAGLAALDGRPAEALTLYREALRAWRDLGLAWDEALCGIDMATLLDPTDPEVRSAAESCREILIRLGANRFSPDSKQRSDDSGRRRVRSRPDHGIRRPSDQAEGDTVVGTVVALRIAETVAASVCVQRIVRLRLPSSASFGKLAFGQSVDPSRGVAAIDRPEAWTTRQLPGDIVRSPARRAAAACRSS